jgi:hypothetical protein
MGALPFDQAIDSALLPQHLASHLRSVSASTVEIAGSRVTFTAGIFRMVGNWNVLVPFRSGELSVQSDSCVVRYTLNCWQLVIVATTMIALIAVFLLVLGGNDALWFLPLMWLWLVGGNLAMGIPRFRSSLARAIAGAPRKSSTFSRSRLISTGENRDHPD